MSSISAQQSGCQLVPPSPSHIGIRCGACYRILCLLNKDRRSLEKYNSRLTAGTGHGEIMANSSIVVKFGRQNGQNAGYEKTDLEVFVVVISKEGSAG